MGNLKGNSYKVRCAKINAIYDKWVKIGLTNREIWRRFIYPEYGTMNMIGVKWFAEMEFWFALIKVCNKLA